MALTALLLMGACTSKSAPTVSPGDAAATIASAYSLPADEQACLETAFRAKPAATRPLASDQPASEGDLRALGAVEDGCIQVSTLATAITAGAADSFASMSDQQRTCLNDSVTSLGDADRVTLLVGLVVPQSLSDIGGAEMGRVTNGILEGCQLSVAADGPQTAPTSTPLTTGP